jgi:hypothetical protein
MYYCDFCNSEPAIACFLVKPATFTVTMPNRKKVRLDSNEHWRACSICEEIIGRGQKIELAQRAKLCQGTIFPIDFYVAMQIVLFWNSTPLHHGPPHPDND